MLKNDLYDDDKNRLNYYIVKNIIIKQLSEKRTLMNIKEVVMNCLSVNLFDSSKNCFLEKFFMEIEKKKKFREFNR